MPCICHGAIGEDEFLNEIINAGGFVFLNLMLKSVADLIKNSDKPTEMFQDVYLDAWVKAFEHHLKGCKG